MACALFLEALYDGTDLYATVPENPPPAKKETGKRPKRFSPLRALNTFLADASFCRWTFNCTQGNKSYAYTGQSVGRFGGRIKHETQSSQLCNYLRNRSQEPGLKKRRRGRPSKAAGAAKKQRKAPRTFHV